MSALVMIQDLLLSSGDNMDVVLLVLPWYKFEACVLLNRTDCMCNRSSYKRT